MSSCLTSRPSWSLLLTPTVLTHLHPEDQHLASRLLLYCLWFLRFIQVEFLGSAVHWTSCWNRRIFRILVHQRGSWSNGVCQSCVVGIVWRPWTCDCRTDTGILARCAQLYKRGDPWGWWRTRCRGWRRNAWLACGRGTSWLRRILCCRRDKSSVIQATF